jgi:hypothetical protein
MWNLKEAAGKALVQRTETAYEVAMEGETAIIVKAQYLPRMRGCGCGGYKCEGECALPREICRPALCYKAREGLGRSGRSQQRAY